MHEVVLSHGLDLLHCHYAIPHATSAWIAREMLERTGSYVPVVTTLHGTDITIVGQDPSYHAITKFSIEKSDGLTAVSSFLQQETLNTFGCTACRIEVIPNFIDPEIYNRSKYTSVFDEQVGRGTRVLMHISNFRPVKRIPDILQVFARVVKRVPSVLVMVGDGPERLDAEQLARDLGVDDKVFFLGKIDAVAPLLAGADLFLMTSDRESFGLGALEALASGVPVIGANVGGLPEVVRSGETGFLTGVGDVESMADAAIDLLLDDAKWQRASALAAEDARARFSQAEIVRRYEEFYTYAIDITTRRRARRVSIETPVTST
jgi:N-acetyl-alpha-D-glucosaminyl L-malate synthase BshA